MLGFVIGTACLLGFVITLARGSRRGYGCGRGFGGGYGPPWAGPRGYRGGFDDDGPDAGRRRGAFFLRGLFERLETTPGQERAFMDAVEELRQAGKKVRGEGKRSLEDLAKGMKSPIFDEAQFGEAFSRHDAAIEELRRAFVGAGAKIHEALDERQRERFARMIEAGDLGLFGRRRWV